MAIVRSSAARRIVGSGSVEAVSKKFSPVDRLSVIKIVDNRELQYSHPKTESTSEIADAIIAHLILATRLQDQNSLCKINLFIS